MSVDLKGKISKTQLAQAKGKFVIHEHRAHRAGLHWDIRVEKDGVLKSFATKKLPEFLSSERKMVLVFVQPDHPIDWLKFEGEIEDGYGAGTVKIYDSGKVTIHSWTDNKILVTFYGQKITGTYGFIKYNKDSYLFFRTKN